MDFHHSRRNANELGAEDLPRNKQTTRYTGVKTVSKYKERSRKDSDLAIEDTKTDLVELLRGEGGGLEVHRAPVALLDDVWATQIASRSPFTEEEKSADQAPRA